MRLVLRLVVYLLAAGMLLCAVLLAYIAFETRGYIYANTAVVPHAEVAIVLGASVTSEGQLSPILKERADKAFELYQKGLVNKLLVTGDNSTLSHDEVDPVAKYLVALGARPQDVFLDHAGFDTYSSMYRAKELFGVTSATVVSQSFHLPRAIYIARRVGIDAYGAEADPGGVSLFNYLREIPATLKAMWDVAFNRQPKYLGKQYPISGDGRQTWGSAASSTVYLLE